MYIQTFFVSDIYIQQTIRQQVDAAAECMTTTTFIDGLFFEAYIGAKT